MCGSGSIAPAPAQPNPPFGLAQCSSCGGIFLNPRPPVDAMKQYYDDYYEQGGGAVSAKAPEPSARQIRRGQRHIRRIGRYLEKPGRILDVGAGDGYLLKAALEAGWSVEGLELSQPRVDRAREWFGLKLHCGDLFNAPYAPGSFDAVGMFQLIEHVHDPCAIIRRVAEFLRPGGVLALSTPNVLAYAGKSRDVNTWRIPRHLFFFTPRTLVRTVESCGFTVVRRPLRWFANLEEQLGWQPWQNSGPLARVTRDLWTPFGLHLIAKRN